MRVFLFGTDELGGVDPVMTEHLNPLEAEPDYPRSHSAIIMRDNGADMGARQERRTADVVMSLAAMRAELAQARTDTRTRRDP